MSQADPPYIRPAEHSELDALVAMVRDQGVHGWTPGAFLSELRLVWSHVDVAVEPWARTPSGVIVFWHVADELQLLNIAVRPERRRRGVGRALMQHLLERAMALGAQRITLEVRRSNKAAQSLYRALGFGVSGFRRGYYAADGDDAVLMSWEASEAGG